MNETLEIKVNEIESMIAANAEKIKEALKMGKKMLMNCAKNCYLVLI